MAAGAGGVLGVRLLRRCAGRCPPRQDTVYWGNTVDPEDAGPADRPRPVAAGPGVPLELADTLVVLMWNDFESFRRLMDERGHEIAAVITYTKNSWSNKTGQLVQPSEVAAAPK